MVPYRYSFFQNLWSYICSYRKTPLGGPSCFDSKTRKASINHYKIVLSTNMFAVASLVVCYFRIDCITWHILMGDTCMEGVEFDAKIVCINTSLAFTVF